jgi:hypothetical protein
MAEIVNLRAVRKTRTRAERESQATANRLKYGLSKAEKDRRRAEGERAVRVHEAHKLPKQEDGEPD